MEIGENYKDLQKFKPAESVAKIVVPDAVRTRPLTITDNSSSGVEMTWLEKLLSQHSELESPTNFWFWGGMAAISAVVKDNVWLRPTNLQSVSQHICYVSC